MIPLARFWDGEDPPIEIIQTASAINTSGAVTYNHSCDIGAAEAGRRVIVLAMSRDAATAFTITGVTVNGVAAVQRAQRAASGGDETRADIWTADVPAGSGAVTVQVTHSTTVDESAVYTIAARNMKSAVPTFSGSSVLDGNVDGTVANVTAQAGGITAGCAASGHGSSTFTWGNLTERYDTSPAGMDATAAYDLQPAAFGPASVTLNGLGTATPDTGAMVVASFR